MLIDFGRALSGKAKSSKGRGEPSGFLELHTKKMGMVVEIGLGGRFKIAKRRILALKVPSFKRIIDGFESFEISRAHGK